MALAVRKPKVMVPDQLRRDLIDIKTEIAIAQYEYGFVPTPAKGDDENNWRRLDDQATKSQAGK